MANKIIYFLGVLISSLLISSGAYAAVDIEVAYIFNTFSFLVCAFLVMWMAAGFCMLESGLVTTKSVSTIAAKNIGKFAIVSVMFYLVGYNLGYGDSENPYFGSFEIWTDNSSLETGYSDYSDWLFQTLFVCATCSIVSGAVAERIKIWPFFIFSAILGGFIYPIQMSWEWGGGWLDSLGFADFAGSTLVHACGGAAALAGIMILGPRLGRFTDDGSPQNMAPFAASSIPLVTLGTFILWMGWFGFNGGSVLAMASKESADAVAMVFVNTNAAAAGGVIAALLFAKVWFGKADLTMTLNGALAGLVAITAGPDTPSVLVATLIGAVGGILVVLSIVWLDRKLRIDDPVGAISVHGVVGLWGLLAVPLTNGDVTFTGQLVGAGTIFVWVFVASGVVWFALKTVMGIRVTKEDEDEGADISECGLEAYPEFVTK